MSRLRRGLMAAAEVIEEDLQSGGSRYRAALVTCTYRPGVDWRPRQVVDALKCFREWCRRRGHWYRYVWRFEFGEQSGRPHYHLVIWLPRGVSMPKWDLQGWWPHGMSNMVWARRPVGYIAKYAAKAAVSPSAEFDVRRARWWGVSGLGIAGRRRWLYRIAPRWVRSKCEEGDDVRRLAHGWWRVGWWEFASPWVFVGADQFGALRFRWRGWDEHSVAYVPEVA